MTNSRQIPTIGRSLTSARLYTYCDRQCIQTLNFSGEPNHSLRSAVTFGSCVDPPLSDVCSDIIITISIHQYIYYVDRTESDQKEAILCAIDLL